MLTYDTAQEARGHHEDAVRLAMATVTNDVAAELQRLNKQIEADPDAYPRQLAARQRLTNIVTLLRAIEAKDKFTAAERQMLEGMVGHNDLMLEALLTKYRGQYDVLLEENAELVGLMLQSLAAAPVTPLLPEWYDKAMKEAARRRANGSTGNLAA